MKRLIGLGFRLGFVPLFFLMFFSFSLFPVLVPVPRFCNIYIVKEILPLTLPTNGLENVSLTWFILIKNKSFNDESSIRVCKEVNLPTLLSLFASYLHVVRWNLVCHGHPWLPGSPKTKNLNDEKI